MAAGPPRGRMIPGHLPVMFAPAFPRQRGRRENAGANIIRAAYFAPRWRNPKPSERVRVAVNVSNWTGAG